MGKSAMQASPAFTGLASDSREVEPGFLFAALAGAKANGAAYLKEAVARGAVAVLGRPRGGTRRAGARHPLLFPTTIRAAPCARGGPLLRRPAAHRRRRHRHQGQVLHRRLRARDLGARWASRPPALGTVGLVTPSGDVPLRHTTPARSRSTACWRS
ncbi:MAG: Mur ligase domain-containing protein [Rhizomicrobium sp.]